MDIDRNDPVPLHYQLKNMLKEAIKAGKWEMGELFPTDKDLMQQHSLSSTTVRRAISELVHEGLLERKPGKGTFVRQTPIEETLGRLSGFFEEMSRQGFTPSAELVSTASVTISQNEIATYPEIKVFSGQDMYYIEKVQNINGKPIVYLISFWLHEYGKRIAQHNLEREGIYQVVDQDLRLVLTKADQMIYAGIASKNIAKLLGIKVGAPVLIMERVTYAGEQPVEYSYNVYRSGQYKYHVTLCHNSDNIGGVWG